MKLIAPDYYKNFTCIADRCRHNCCIGWEIDIDSDTYELYKNIPGKFGDRLREGISWGDVPCFKLGDGERCVFLNERGLCDIILNLSEKALCDICTDHPRFRNFFADRTEVGLGISCEEACRLILGCPDAVRLVEMEDDGEDTPEETAFFEERGRVFDVIQDRTATLSERFAVLEEEYGIGDDTDLPKSWAEFYRDLERLDPAWEECLDRLANCAEFAVPDGNTAWEQLAVYLVYRHSADYSISDSVAFAIHTVKLICTVSGGDFTEICDTCRMWSGEIEYSEENTEKVIGKFVG